MNKTFYLFFKHCLSLVSKKDLIILVSSLFLISLNVFLIWRFPFLPFQDHPSHLLRQNVILNYNNPVYDYKDHFLINIKPIPNILADLGIVFLGKFFPVRIASKIFYSFYMVCFPLAFGFFLFAINRKLVPYILLSVLYSYSYFTLMGNENFLLSLVFLFLLWGIVFGGYLKNILFGRLLVLFIIALIYFSHFFTFYIAVVSITCYLLLKRDFKLLIRYVFYFLPFSVIFLIWQGAESGTLKFKHDYLGIEVLIRNKLLTLLNALSPFLNCESSIIMGFIGFVGFFMIMFNMVVDKNIDRSRVFVFLSVLVNIILPSTLFFYGPDQRSFFIAFLFSVSLFPTGKYIRYVTALLLVICSLFCLSRNYSYFKGTNSEMVPMIRSLTHIPAGLNVLPVLFNPYLLSYFSHRVFEYYNFYKGGVNPYHFFTKNNIVVYKVDPVDIDIYRKGTKTYSPDFLNRFDAVAVFGKVYESDVLSFLKYLRNKGFNKFIVKSFNLNILSK